MGESIQNKLYLPEPQNDFIFATIGEEFGYLGSMAVMLLFVILLWRGIKIAINAKDRSASFWRRALQRPSAFKQPSTSPRHLLHAGYRGSAALHQLRREQSVPLLAQMGILLSISRTSGA